MTPAERDKIETLEEENRQLRALKLPLDTPYHGLGFSKTERVVMAALMDAGTCCMRNYLMDCIAFSSLRFPAHAKNVDVALHRVRKKLAVMGFPGAIETIWGEGWRIRNGDVKARLTDFFAATKKGTT